MATEVERKFLVSGDGWRRDADPGTPIRQAYLVRAAERSVRVRRAGTAAYLTVKGSGGLTRAEFEYPVPVDDAEAMFALCEPGEITKTRYRVSYAGRVWEVDVFAGRHAGLVLAEVELPDVDTAVDLPPWVGAEVTDDPAYTNARLSDPGSAPPR